MTDNYDKIVLNNLEKLYKNLPADLAGNLPGKKEGDCFELQAFGENCVIAPDGIQWGEGEVPSVMGILLSLYALNACPDKCIQAPFKAFKELPDSMPYVGAFATHTEQVLAPHASRIRDKVPEIMEALRGGDAPAEVGGDFSFVVYPLPKIALCYIFYEADEDFPASVTCLYSNNAHRFLPVDGLADVGEYTSRKILQLISHSQS